MMAIANSHRLRILLRDLQHILPVARVDLRRGILFRHRDSIHPVPGRDIQNLVRLPALAKLRPP